MQAMLHSALVSENARNNVAIACGLGLVKGDEKGLLRQCLGCHPVPPSFA